MSYLHITQSGRACCLYIEKGMYQVCEFWGKIEMNREKSRGRDSLQADVTTEMPDSSAGDGLILLIIESPLYRSHCVYFKQNKRGETEAFSCISHYIAVSYDFGSHIHT